jgi:AraC family transcriptional regulator, regulatory protein of adaptative response / DNA-3-methyladenine glycosylase II
MIWRARGTFARGTSRAPLLPAVMESNASEECSALRHVTITSRSERVIQSLSLEKRCSSDAVLDPAICLEALRSRDSRFDGRFFPGVVTTNVYCRTICPIPLRRPENIRWFPTAASAEKAGFRPCRRCNPHISPGAPAWFGTAAVVSRALNLILEGGLDGGNVDALAERVGIGSRHLRRLFVQHMGASPLKIANTRRVHFARTLVEETDLPITDIAFRSGFKSIRRFNESMNAAFESPPKELRRYRGNSARPATNSGIVIYLSYRPPLDWPALIGFLAPRATPGVEQIDQNSYRRVIEVGEDSGEIEVRPDRSRPRLQVRVKLKRYVHLVTVVERVRRLFDLFADPVQVSLHLSKDQRVKGPVAAHRGLRVPGAWDGFEVAVRAVLGESLIAPAPKEPIGKLVRAFGRPTGSLGELSHLFPSPQILAQADLSHAGIWGARADAIREIARAVCERPSMFEASNPSGNFLSRSLLTGLSSEGMVDYIMMRAFGEPDIFPLSMRDLDVFSPASAAIHSSDEILRAAERWRPWRSYAALHLLQLNEVPDRSRSQTIV